MVWYSWTVDAKREQIIHLAFVCRFSVEETREYFMYAISEHDFQVNDYHEMIALYGFGKLYDL